MIEPKIARYRDRVLSCWLGKAIGGTLGLPFEGDPGPLDITFYTPVPTEMLPNDDLDLQVLWACILDKMEEVQVSRHILAAAWQAHCGFPWDEYGVASRNIADGLTPPQTGAFDNWFTRGMGAAIRSEVWACLAPGDPALAAKYAYEDACIDHAGEGIWAEVFLAALQSAAFLETDPDTLLDQSEAALPENSEIRRAVHDTRLWWSGTQDWRAVRENILLHWGHENFTDVVMNVAFTVLGWLAGEGDFSRSICIANNCGMDTDCTAATVGSLMGILDPDCIPARWLAPIGRDLVVSREIVGIAPPSTLDGFTDLVSSLRDRLNGRVPDAVSEEQPIAEFRIAADAGWVAVLPAAGADAPGMPAGFQPFMLLGTYATLAASAFADDVLMLHIPFFLDQAQATRIMFNTPSACRVWVDDQYAFGRDGGTMAPSLHRVPAGQAVNRDLGAGEHIILAAIGRPAGGRDAEWVVAVGDPATNQWLPGAFRRRL